MEHRVLCCCDLLYLKHRFLFRAIYQLINISIYQKRVGFDTGAMLSQKRQVLALCDDSFHENG